MGDKIFEPKPFCGTLSEDPREWIQKTESWLSYNNYANWPNLEEVTDEQESINNNLNRIDSNNKTNDRDNNLNRVNDNRIGNQGKNFTHSKHNRIGKQESGHNNTDNQDNNHSKTVVAIVDVSIHLDE